MDYWVFGDESGNFDFASSGTKFFIVGTLVLPDPLAESLSKDLRELRQKLASDGIDHDGVFHASEDRQVVRDRVLPLIIKAAPLADVTILEKAKAYPRLRETDELFYQYAWYHHLRHRLPRVGQDGDTVHVVLGDIGTKRKRAAFRSAAEKVLGQLDRPSVKQRLYFWKPGAHEGIQAADYVLWAVARYVEGGDDRSYRMISQLLKTEFRLFR